MPKSSYMKKIFFITLVFTFLIIYSEAQSNLETIYVRGSIKIVKPSVENIMRLCDMSYQEFVTEIKDLGYEKSIINDEIVYQKGSPQEGGIQYITKTVEYVTYIWAHLNNNTTILTSLEEDLEQYYLGPEEGGNLKGRVYGIRKGQKSYEIKIFSSNKNETILARGKSL